MSREELSAYEIDAGCDDIYVTQVAPEQKGFLRFYEREVLPEFAIRVAGSSA